MDLEGPYGKLNVNDRALGYSFNGKYLRPETEYALVQYLGDVTGDRGDIWIVGLGLSNGNGDLHISGEWQPWLGRFWVVLGEDVVGEADGLRCWTGWHRGILRSTCSSTASSEASGTYFARIEA